MLKFRPRFGRHQSPRSFPRIPPWLFKTHTYLVFISLHSSVSCISWRFDLSEGWLLGSEQFVQLSQLVDLHCCTLRTLGAYASSRWECVSCSVSSAQRSESRNHTRRYRVVYLCVLHTAFQVSPRETYLKGGSQKVSGLLKVAKYVM